MLWTLVIKFFMNVTLEVKHYMLGKRILLFKSFLQLFYKVYILSEKQNLLLMIFALVYLELCKYFYHVGKTAKLKYFNAYTWHNQKIIMTFI